MEPTGTNQKKDMTKPDDYSRLLSEIKERIRSAQYAALKVVNKELVGLYWDIGKKIVARQEKAEWGKAVVEQLAIDLRKEFPGISGFSASNLWILSYSKGSFFGIGGSKPIIASPRAMMIYLLMKWPSTKHGRFALKKMPW